MDLRQKIEMFVTKNEKDCVFSCPHDMPLGSIFDALCDMMNHVVERMKQHNEAVKPQQPVEETKQEEPTQG